MNIFSIDWRNPWIWVIVIALISGLAFVVADKYIFHYSFQSQSKDVFKFYAKDQELGITIFYTTAFNNEQAALKAFKSEYPGWKILDYYYDKENKVFWIKAHPPKK